MDRQPVIVRQSLWNEHQGYNVELVLPSNIPFGIIQLSHDNNGDIELQRSAKQRHNENKGIILGRCFTAHIDFVVSANMPTSCTYKAFCYGCIIHIMFLPGWLLFLLRALRAHYTADRWQVCEVP